MACLRIPQFLSRLCKDITVNSIPPFARSWEITQDYILNVFVTIIFCQNHYFQTQFTLSTKGALLTVIFLGQVHRNKYGVEYGLLSTFVAKL
jgi:hypothetical protein